LFNAGVGGDKIENVLYRLDLGLLPLLEDRNVKLWVVIIGSNDLTKIGKIKKALLPSEVERYRLLLQALLRTSATSQIIACALFQRSDVANEDVLESNRLLHSLTLTMNTNFGERILWLEATRGLARTPQRLYTS
jgi:hypothetical protein